MNEDFILNMKIFLKKKLVEIFLANFILEGLEMI